jgi:hypothetical protein
MSTKRRKPIDLARAVAGAFKAAKGNEAAAVETIERLLTKWIAEAATDAIENAIGATRGTSLTDAALVAWLRGVEGVAAREGARWRGLRLPGDLGLHVYTDDRGRLHMVGALLEDIARKARLAAGFVEDMRPKTYDASKVRMEIGGVPVRGFLGVDPAHGPDEAVAIAYDAEGRIAVARIPVEAAPVPSDARHYKSSATPSTPQEPAGGERSSGPGECPGSGQPFAPGDFSAVLGGGFCPVCRAEVRATPLGRVKRHPEP